MIPPVLILDMRYADPNYVGFIPTFRSWEIRPHQKLHSVHEESPA